MKITALFFGVFAGCLSSIPAQGADYLWNGGNGSWTDSGAWRLNGFPSDWSNGNTAQFQTDSSITIGNGVITSGMFYDTATVTLANGSLILSGSASGSNGGSAILSNTSLTLDASNAEDFHEVRNTSLRESSALTKTGSGTVALGGTHTASGVWNINGGTLVFSGERNITANDNNRINGKINIASGAVLDASNGRLFHNSTYTANYQSPTIMLNGGTLKLNQFGYDSATLGKLHNNFYALKFVSGTSSRIVISQGYESGGTANRGIYIAGWGTTAKIELGDNQTLTWASSNAQYHDAIVCETGAGSALELSIGKNSVLHFNQIFANKNTSNEYDAPTVANFSGLSLIKSGSGELVIQRSNTISSDRGVRVDAGSLTLEVDNAFGSGGNLGNVNIASGALLSMNGHMLSNVIDVQNGATLNMGGSTHVYTHMVNWHEGGILLNTENNKGTLNIMTRASLELGAKAWAGSVVTDTDTVFTLTADQQLGALGANVNCWIGGRAHDNSLQSITFTGGCNLNIDDYGAKWAVIHSENVTFQDIGNLAFSNNAANMSNTDALYGSGAIAANDAVTFNNTGSLTFNNNSVNADYSASGGAIYASGGASFSNTGAISFSGNSAMTHGGAIHTGGATGSLIFSDIMENISFTGNSAGENGGAINNDYETVEWVNVGHVDFSDNVAENGGGGAIWAGGDVAVNEATSFSMTGNEARGGGGGAIYSDGNVTFSGVGILTFSDNFASSYGGAIGVYGDISISDSGTISFSSNTAYEGGALDAYTVTISGNSGTVLFENNRAENVGGAINLQAGGSVFLTADQSDIIFRGNTVQDGSIYNAIHFNGESMASFNAGENCQILFEDGLSSQDESVVDINVNDSAGSIGMVAMSGVNSQSDIRANTTVYGGTFAVSNGATYGYNSPDWSAEEARTSFTVNGGTLHIGERATLNAADVRLEDEAELSIEGAGRLNTDTLTLGNNVSLLGTGEGYFSITANAIDISQGITINLSQDSVVGLELHAGVLTLGGPLTLGDDQVDYTSSIWQNDRSFLVMDASGVTNMDGAFSEILSSLSNSASITVGNLGLEGRDPALELGYWGLRWDENHSLYQDWISNGLVVPEPASPLLILLAAGSMLAIRKRTF